MRIERHVKVRLAVILVFIGSWLGSVFGGGSVNAGEVIIHDIDGLSEDSLLRAGTPVKFYLRLRNLSSDSIDDLANRFRIYSPDRATWEPSITIDTSIMSFPPGHTSFDTSFYRMNWMSPDPEDTGYWDDNMTAVFAFVSSDHDSSTATPALLGQGSDTLTFAGYAVTEPGIEGGSDYVIWSFEIDSVTENSVGRSICVDSVHTVIPNTLPDQDSWYWHLKQAETFVDPDWSSEVCLTIVSCCQGFRGNVNLDLDGTVNISDLTYLVGWMFGEKAEPPCMLEADVNGDSSHNVEDLTHLVGYMFNEGSAPAGCP